MRRCLILIVILLCANGLSATPFSPTWICAPWSVNGADVWFRHTYSFPQRPRLAYISMATTGRAELFVNGRNVSTDVLIPTRQRDDGSAVAVVYDVTRFLHGRNNTVAVWFSPTVGNDDARQLALYIYGTTADGRRFCHEAGGDWLCRQAPVEVDDEGFECIDGRVETNSWHDDEIDIALWTNADEIGENRFLAQNCASSFDKELNIDYTATKIDRIVSPRFFDVVGDSVVYDFGCGVEGMLRVTLRDAKRGERICFGNVRYTCNGELDEQIIQRFHTTNARRVLVYGDDKFKRSQIFNVEILTTVPYRRFSYK